MTEFVDPRTLKTDPLFTDLFSIPPGVLWDLIKSMRTDGFDDLHPIEVWRLGDVVIDGHVRLAAAIVAGIPAVPVRSLSLPSRRDALERAVTSKRNQRTLSDAEIARCVMALDSLPYGDRE